MRPAHPVHCLLLLTLLLTACGKKKDEEAKKPRREDIMKAAAAERQTVLAFAAALRREFDWKRIQPLPKDDAARATLRRELARRFAAIPATGLPADLQQAWTDLQPVFERLAESTGPVPGTDTAAKAMNQALTAHGILDLKF